jgi:hypothetical protein
MPLDPTHSSRKFTLLPVDTVNFVSTLKDGVEIANLELTFEVDVDHAVYSTAKRKRATLDLKPKGSEIPVTEANREEYLQLFVEHRLVLSVYGRLAFDR